MAYCHFLTRRELRKRRPLPREFGAKVSSPYFVRTVKARTVDASNFFETDLPESVIELMLNDSTFWRCEGYACRCRRCRRARGACSPLRAATARHRGVLRAAEVVQEDETSWPVQDVEGTAVRLRILPARGSPSGLLLLSHVGSSLASTGVCDRWSASKKLRQMRQRRDIRRVVTGHPQAGQWAGEWLERMAGLFRL